MKKASFFAVLCAFVFVCNVHAVAPLSQYGQIQNVQNYSTNPFYQQGVYNPKAPQAIYATGADLNTGDCQRTVENLVASECSMRNNCRGLRISDVRPAIVVKLSQLPGHNFATSCAGYIDSAFDNYMAKQGYKPINTTAFPTPVSSNTNTGFKIDNPYKQKLSAAEKGIQERTEELKQLQKQTQTTPHAVVGGDFPKTMADVSFTDRIAVAKEGYEPFKDLKAFREIKIESDEDFLDRLKLINVEEYCRRVPNASECKKEEPKSESTSSETSGAENPDTETDDEVAQTSTDDDEKEIIEAMVKFMNPQNADEQEFFTALVTSCVKKREKNPNLWLDENFVYDFLGTNRNLDKYSKPLIGMTGVMEDEDFGIQIDWDEVLVNTSTVLDKAKKKHTIKVCENNRSWEVGIEVITDVIAVVVSIYSFGAGGAAVAAGRTAVGAGLRALAKGAMKLGFKSVGKKLLKSAAKQFAKQGIKKVTKLAAKEAAKRALKQIGKNIITKRGLLTVAGLVGYGVGKNALKTSATGVLYSLVSSDETKDILNCHDLDHNEGCYLVCGDGPANDELNAKVFQPILGKTYCVNPADYNLYEISASGQMGDVMVFDEAQFSKIRSALKNVADKGACDRNEDDIDAYLGYFIYDPDTMEINKESMYIEDLVRIDD